MLILLAVLTGLVFVLLMRRAYKRDRMCQALAKQAALQRQRDEILRQLPLRQEDLDWIDWQARQVWLTEFEWAHKLKQARGIKPHRYPITYITHEAWLRMRGK